MAAKTIALKGGFIRKEGEASAAITPGYLVEFGGANDLQAHATAGGSARKAFALENDLIGKGVDDAYAAGETVQYGVFEQGAEVMATLAVSQTIAKGDRLVSNGNGQLREIGTEPEQDSIVGWAMEAVTTTSATARITVEVA